MIDPVLQLPAPQAHTSLESRQGAQAHTSLEETSTGAGSHLLIKWEPDYLLCESRSGCSY